MNGYTRRDIVTWHLSAHLGGILCTSFHLLISLATFTAALNGRQIQTDLVCDSVSRIISKTQQHCSLLRSYYFGRNIHFCHKSNLLCSAPDCSSNVIIKRHRLSAGFLKVQSDAGIRTTVTVLVRRDLARHSSSITERCGYSGGPWPPQTPQLPRILYIRNNTAGIDSPREHILFIAFIRSFIHYERADSIRRPLSQHNKNIIVVTGKVINIE